jgi:hypothetical protein
MKILNYKILDLTGHLATSIYKAKLDDHVNMGDRVRLNVR